LYLTTLITSLPLPFEQAVRRISDLGFGYVDVVGIADRPESHREALAETDLVVSCAAVGRDLPGDAALDTESIEKRRLALAMVKRQIDDAAALGATCCYLTAGSNVSPDGLLCYSDACTLLADHARQRMLRLCVEHVPGRALPTAASVLDWLAALGHPNLYLLLDIGHCQITKESPRAIIERAADRLGYVHLDDNDGQSDLHWPLLHGVMQEQDLKETITALKQAKYVGGVCLELSAANEQPDEGLRHGREILASLLTDPV
jgi:sugar phosphate isomerase/epimerase